MVQPSALGYQLTNHKDSGGHITYQLAINMSNAPTMEHYDPDEMWLHVGDEHLCFERITLRHPLMQPVNRRACAGRIGLCDRKGKCVTFFTYGGHFGARTTNDLTQAVLTSTAPIIRLLRGGNAQRFAEESEVLLARYRAQPDAGRDCVESLLCHVDPFRLYTSVLIELLDNIRSIPSKYFTDDTREYCIYLSAALRHAKRNPQWSHTVRPLSELLS